MARPMEFGRATTRPRRIYAPYVAPDRRIEDRILRAFTLRKEVDPERGLTDTKNTVRTQIMPNSNLIPPENVRVLFQRWRETTSEDRMEIAMALMDYDPKEANYSRRQVASARLSGALYGKERMSLSRWALWLHRASLRGVRIEDLYSPIDATPTDPEHQRHLLDWNSTPKKGPGRASE